MKLKSDPVVLAAREALADFSYFCRRCFTIRRKDGSIGPLELNRAQLRFVEAVEKQRRAGKPVRVVVPKARQVGISTVTQAYLLWWVLRRTSGVLRAFVLAHERESAARLYEITRFAVSCLPEWFRRVLGVGLEYETKGGLTFSWGSSFTVSSSDSKEPGRSGTIHLLHLSEAAYYEDPKRLLRAVFAAVPKHRNTVVVVESTGNGPVGWFAELAQAAEKGRNEYALVFAPWWEQEEYRMPVPPGERAYCPPELEHLYRQGLVDDEQLWWRQWVIENDYNGDEDAFRQEYPATLMECFMPRDVAVFDVAVLKRRLAEVEEAPPPVEGVVLRGVRGPEFTAQPGGRVKVWKFPEPGKLYVVGVDVGSGIGREEDEHSNSCADVIEVTSGEQVVQLYGRMEPEVLAQHVAALGAYYNNALVAVEVTGGHGLACNNALRDLGYLYLYRRRVFDKVSQDWKDALGWNTTNRTKELIVDELRADFRSGAVRINCKETLVEMASFIRHDNGKLAASPGNKDDRVMSLAIANHVRREYSAPAANLEKAREEAASREREGALPAPVARTLVSLRERRYDDYMAVGC